MEPQGLGKGRKKAATARQVADLARVSIATVSRVVNEKGGVSPELEARVREVTRQLHYSPNRIARGFRQRRMQTIGVIVTDIQNPFFTSLLQGVERVLEAAGYGLLLCNSDEQPTRESHHFEALQAENVAGIILAPSSAERERYQHVIDNGTPIVVIDREVPGLKADSVTLHNRAGVINAMNHLLELGHRRIGVISGPRHTSTASLREEGYHVALHNAGIPVDEAYIKLADFKQKGGYTAMLELLEMPSPPTAVVVLNNLMTLGALQALNEKGVNVPAELSLLGFDDMPWATSLRPPLTVVAQPTLALGETAAQLLMLRIQHPDRPIHSLMLEASLVVRESTSPLPVTA